MKKILSFLKDKFKNKIQIIIIILVIVLFPIIIRILECIFDFDIDANGWVGFLGSYIGSIIGAITALMVVNIEIKNSRKEKKNDEIKQLRPYLWLFVESIENNNVCGKIKNIGLNTAICNGVQREHNKKLNNGLPILHKVPPKRDYGRYFCIMAEKGGTSHGGLTEKLSPFFHAKKQEVNAYGR